MTLQSLSTVLTEAAVIAPPIRDLTSVLVATLVAIALIARAPAARWTALIAALAVAPLLLAGAVLDDDRASRLLDRPVLLVVGGGIGLVALVIAVAVLVRWPKLLPAMLAVAIPLRLPITIGGESVNLLLPLYGLIGAGALAQAVRARRRGRELAESWDLRQGPSTSEVLQEAWTARSLHGVAAAVPVLLAASVAIYALRIPFSIDPDRGVQTLCFFLVPFAAMFLVLREVEWSRAELQRVAGALVVLAVVAVALGDYEYVTGQVLWHQNVVDENSLNSTIRVNSLFFDPNIYGRFLMVILLGVLSALAWGARGLRVVGLAVLFALLWTGMFVTYSQSSMLGLLVGAVVLLGLRFGAGRAVAVGGVMAVAALVAVFALGGLLRIDATSSEGLDNSSAGRWALIQGGGELFAAKPVFGWGSGGYRKAYREQTDVSSVRAVAASHTIPITVAAEQGVIGLAIYLALVVGALVALLRRAHERLARAAIAAAFIALVVHSWLYAAFLEDPLTWALLAVGLSLAADHEAEDRIAVGDPAGPGGHPPVDGADPPVHVPAPAAGSIPHTPHDIVGPVTVVGIGEGAGPGAAIGESGRPVDALDGGHGVAPPRPPSPRPRPPAEPGSGA